MHALTADLRQATGRERESKREHERKEEERGGRDREIRISETPRDDPTPGEWH